MLTKVLTVLGPENIAVRKQDKILVLLNILVTIPEDAQANGNYVMSGSEKCYEGK